MKHCVAWLYASTLALLPQRVERKNLSKGALHIRRVLPAGSRIERIQIA
jgi:hypothetical protein